jgi:hypothetical protein
LKSEVACFAIKNEIVQKVTIAIWLTPVPKFRVCISQEMGMNTRLAAMSAIFVIGLASLATSAQANTVYDFTITSTTGNASGQFTTTDGLGPQTVIDVTGTVGINAITALSNYGGSSNLIYDPPGNRVDRAGLAFTAGGLNYNIFSITPAANNYGFCVSNVQLSCTGSEADNAPAAVFTLTLASTSGVPGPIVGAGLPGLLAAFGGILAWRRRRSVTA